MFNRLYLPLAKWAPMQPATIDPTLDLCTRYPLRLGGPRQRGIRSLPDTCTHGQHWESLDLLILSPTPYPLGYMLPGYINKKLRNVMSVLQSLCVCVCACVCMRGGKVTKTDAFVWEKFGTKNVCVRVCVSGEPGRGMFVLDTKMPNILQWGTAMTNRWNEELRWVRISLDTSLDIKYQPSDVI